MVGVAVGRVRDVDAVGAVSGHNVADGVDRGRRPGVDAGVEMLGRRGEDQRFDESRAAARRRRAIDEAMDDRGEGETRADVARRLDKPERYGPTSYEIGTHDDPDWAENDPGVSEQE